MIMVEVNFAARHPECVIGHRLAGWRGSNFARVRWADSGAVHPLAPETFNEFTFRIPDATVAFPNVVLALKGCLNSGNGYTLTELADLGIPGFPVTRVDGQFKINVPDEAFEIDVCAYVQASRNYSSFLLGELPRLQAYESHIAAGVPLVVHGDVQPFHRELLAMVGVTDTQLISVPKEKVVRAGTLFHATPTFRHWTVPSEAIDYLKSRLGPHIQDASAYRRVYLSRSRLGPDADRRIVNEVEMEACLARHDFAIIHPQDLTAKEQLALFASAEFIIAPFGAMWASAIFRRPDVRSAMLATKLNPEFGRIYQHIGEDLFLLPIGSEKVRDASAQSRAFDFTIRPEDFAIIEALVTRLG
jgi:capsular polysaccharide biosynthesis protein